MPKERIIITGVAGFIGSNLAATLLARGHRITGIDNFSYGRKENITALLTHPAFSMIEGDLMDAGTLPTEPCTVIVHLASQKIPRYTNSLRTIVENDQMTSTVIKKCLQDKARLVFASTSDVYGKNSAVPFNEESDLVMGPTKVKRWAYAVSKIHSEHKIIANGEANGLNYVIMRFFGSYGPHQNLTWWGGPQSVFIEKALRKEAIELHGDGQQTRTFTYVEDTVQGVVKCVEDERANKEVFNIAAEASLEISIADLAVLIWKLIRPEDTKPLITFIPYSTFGGGYEDVQRRVPDISKIKRMLDYAPKFQLEEGLVRTIEWQRKQYP